MNFMNKKNLGKIMACTTATFLMLSPYVGAIPPKVSIEQTTSQPAVELSINNLLGMTDGQLSSYLGTIRKDQLLPLLPSLWLTFLSNHSAAWHAAWNAARNACGYAWHAAWKAARDAESDAARDAARDARYDAFNAAWNAARNDARNAAWNAAWNDAWNDVFNACYDAMNDAWNAARNDARDAWSDSRGAWSDARNDVWQAAWDDAWNAARHSAENVAWDDAWNDAFVKSWQEGGAAYNKVISNSDRDDAYFRNLVKVLVQQIKILQSAILLV